MDGSTPARARVEREADRFASWYLMPARLVSERFAIIFGAPPFELTDDTAFALLGLNLEQAKRILQSRRDLSRGIARTERFNGRQVVSLAKQFGVSLEAMAIRIEELKLLGDSRPATAG